MKKFRNRAPLIRTVLSSPKLLQTALKCAKPCEFEQKREQKSQLFRHFDRSKNGVVDPFELASGLARIGMARADIVRLLQVPASSSSSSVAPGEAPPWCRLSFFVACISVPRGADRALGD